MSIVLRKELRLLLPAWVATVVMTTVPAWCTHAAWFARNGLAVGIVSIACFALGTLFLALSPFGQELSFGTFSLMLAQPQTRRRLWWIKMSALAAAVALSLAAMCLSWQLRTRGIVMMKNMPFSSVLTGFGPLAGFDALLAMVVVSGGLWTTLLFRQVTAAFWFSLFVPAAILVLVQWLAGDGPQALLAEVVVMGVYSIAGFALAGRLFLRAQDTPWGNEEVSLPASSGRSLRLLGWVFQQKRGSWAALLGKELQMQQVTLFMAAGLGLIYLAAILVLAGKPSALNGFIFGLGELFWMPWLLVPLVLGSAAVAEERRLNTLQDQLCLPARKRTLFGMKLVVVLYLGVVFGAVMPWLVSGLSHWAGVRANFAGLSSLDAFAILSVLTAAIAFYASTLSRTTIQALGIGLVLIMLAFSAVSVITALHPGYVPPFLGEHWYEGHLRETTLARLTRAYDEISQFFVMDLHIRALAWPAAIAAFFWLAYGNFRRLQVNQQMWLANLFGLLTAAALTLLVSNLIHARPWECFMRLEPAHGPPRISAAGAGRMKVAASYAFDWKKPAWGFFVLLPDGRLWAERVEPPFDRKAARAPGKFVDSSNWVDLASARTGAAGIQSDHTLWKIDSSARATRIGDAADWQAVAEGQDYLMALKLDGTLWHSTNAYESGKIGSVRWRQARPAADGAPVALLGYGSDWCGLYSAGRCVFGVKRDGSVWQLEDRQLMEEQPDGSIVVRDIFQAARGAFTGTNWSSLAGQSQIQVAVSGDGGLWAAGLLSGRLFGQDSPAGLHEQAVRIGGSSEWREVAGTFWSVAAVKTNGTLWMQNEPGSPEAWRPSDYSDWMAVTIAPGEWITTLAADGTLSVWSPQYRSILGLPEPKQRPLLSLNLFNTP